MAQIVFDGTVHFTNRFFGKFDRTIDQMVQAARSGKQNIVEGSMASATSSETEIKLTCVARASLEELIVDYEDFLRTRKLNLWDKDHRLTLRLREMIKNTPNSNYDTFKKAIEHEDPEICANALLTLTRITGFLLDRQISALQERFLRNGGLRERMLAARLKQKKKDEQQKNEGE
jgi:four helix bundle suffix protein